MVTAARSKASGVCVNVRCISRFAGILYSNQGLFLPLLQLTWCFSMVGLFGFWGCAAGAAGIGASTSFTFKIAQFDANWIPLGVTLWSVMLIMGSEAAFLWEEQAFWRSATTVVTGLATLYYLHKSVSLQHWCLISLYGMFIP